MRYSFTAKLSKEIKKIKQRQPQLFSKINKTLLLFEENPEHPSLNTHKLKGNLSGSWSVSIDEGRRLLFYLEDNIIVFYKVGLHDEVYQRN